MNRYEVTQTPERDRWVILDRRMWGYCALVDGETVMPLEWTSKAAGEAWLNKCYKLWEVGTVPAPQKWRPLQPGESSPWVVPTGPPVLPWM